jgi:prepilin-type N-terminal cleavage/methylation domain-containing protein
MKTNYSTPTAHSAFTLTELLIVVGIISTLIVSAAIGGVRLFERAQAQELADLVIQLKTAVNLYYSDTHQFPLSVTLAQAGFPAYNYLMTQPPPPSLPSWNGPYIEDTTLTSHSWNGAIRYTKETSTESVDDDLAMNFFIILDDDQAPPKPANSGIIPSRVLQNLDMILDDGNLSTGEVRGNGCNTSDSTWFKTECGEAAIRIKTP